ncbi:hypothetical protein HBI46_080270 [Parastagonospora nodorum]|nr:hypothetical protein HBI46_080270 [Parastagonospora nodorum]
MLFPLLFLFTLATFLRTTHLLYRCFFHLNRFRGPALAAYTRLWLARKCPRLEPNLLPTDDPNVQ